MSRSQQIRTAFGAIYAVIFWAGVSSAADVLALVDGEPVSYEEFEQFAYVEARQTYYHGTPPEGQAMIEFRQQIANKLIDRKLMIREARRRGLEPNEGAVSEELAGYERQYGATDRWKTEGSAMLAKLRLHFEAESLLEQVDPLMRAVPDPADGEVAAYYRDNLEKFTEPEKVRLSVILISVPPSSDEDEWDAAREEAGKIAERIRNGQLFAEAARLHSADSTAANGGDMGYLHAGALNPAVQEAVSQLQVGEMVADPITVLEGVAIVKVEGRQDSQVHDLVNVFDRAKGLWAREKAEQVFNEALAELRVESNIWLDEDYLQTVPGE
jgi:parvulin-like peptidyl-prolyl isomerase